MSQRASCRRTRPRPDQPVRMNEWLLSSACWDVKTALLFVLVGGLILGSTTWRLPVVGWPVGSVLLGFGAFCAVWSLVRDGAQLLRQPTRLDARLLLSAIVGFGLGLRYATVFSPWCVQNRLLIVLFLLCGSFWAWLGYRLRRLWALAVMAVVATLIVQWSALQLRRVEEEQTRRMMEQMRYLIATQGGRLTLQ